MRNAKCNDCGQTFSTNETIKISESILCRTCAEKLLQTRKGVPKEQIQRQFDPTVCANCGKDNGNLELMKLAGLPACEQCITFFRNRPYPMWIKAAMVGLAAIVVFSFIWNWRFVQAYINIRTSETAVRAGNLETAAKLFRSAATKVPEVKDLSAIALFYEGAQMLREDKPDEALKLLNSSKAELPQGFPVDEIISLAEIGVAFDNKDYDKFLTLALQASEKRSNNPTAVAQVASAYACKYAVTGDDQFKQQSLDFLKKARTLSEQQGGLNEFAEYEGRILHRIETRDIISHDEFKKRFPNGWKQQQ